MPVLDFHGLTIYPYQYQVMRCGKKTDSPIWNLKSCLIRSLRKKLEPDPRHPKYIHTVRGVGDKFELLSEE